MPLYHFALLRPNGTASNIWQYDHQPDEIPEGAETLPLSDEQWNDWLRDTSGWRWNDGKGVLEKFELPPPVPQSVSIVQACITLHRTPSPLHPDTTLYDEVTEFVNGSNNPELKIAWERATSLDRQGSFVTAVAQQMGLSDEQVDNLFIAATQVTV